MVLKVHTVRVGGHGYYVNELPRGREAGTGLTGERPGRWMGRAAEGLGLGDRVEAEAFADVLSGRNPILGRPLPVKRDLVTVAGYDLVFCAPKSVSLLHALGSAELSSEVGAGHDAAVDATTDYLARVALGVRRQAQGQSRTVLPTTGMMAGAFLHRTSRALDPHLHTHVVEVNVAQGIDGTWSAVDGRGLFAHRAAAGRLYQAHLRHELTARLGVAWDVRPTGLGDVVGVEPGLRGLFSQRSAAIKEYMAERSGRASARGAFYATRPDKDRTVSVETLAPRWRARADEFGYDIGVLNRVVGLNRVVSREHDCQSSFDAERLQSSLTERARPDATLARREIMSAVATAHVGGARVAEVEAAVDRLCSVAQPTVDDRPGRTRRWAVPALTEAARACESELPVSSVSREHWRLTEREPRDRSTGSSSPRLAPRERHREDRGRDRGQGRERDKGCEAQRDTVRERGQNRGPDLGRDRGVDRGLGR
jgi:conjugative relaxase-like TrwC/TraI family protein